MDKDVVSGENAAVIFEHVSLTYSGGGDESLTDIDFVVKKGDTIGIIGGTGSGKTSVVNLIPRFYDATKGRVIVDGIPVKDYEISALREKSVLFRRRQFCSREQFERIFCGEMKMPLSRILRMHCIFRRRKSLLIPRTADLIL